MDGRASNYGPGPSSGHSMRTASTNRLIPVPKLISRKLLPGLSNAELKAYLHIISRTAARHLHSAAIPISDFQVGLSTRSIMYGIHSLEQKRLLSVERHPSQVNVYTPTTTEKQWIQLCKVPLTPGKGSLVGRPGTAGRYAITPASMRNPLVPRKTETVNNVEGADQDRSGTTA